MTKLWKLWLRDEMAAPSDVEQTLYLSLTPEQAEQYEEQLGEIADASERAECEFNFELEEVKSVPNSELDDIIKTLRAGLEMDKPDTTE